MYLALKDGPVAPCVTTVGDNHLPGGRPLEEQNLPVHVLWRGKALFYSINLQVSDSVGGEAMQNIHLGGISPSLPSCRYVPGWSGNM